MSDLCDVCGREKARTPTGGWQCEECDGIAQLRRDLAELEAANRALRRLRLIAVEKWGECVDALNAANDQREEARRAAREAAAADWEFEGEYADWLARYPWVKDQT